jgi:hypothetical protein
MNEDTVRKNLALLTSRATREAAMSESLGGNAGAGCYALNLQIDWNGQILSTGNDPERANATLRVYVPYPPVKKAHLHEMAVEVTGEMTEEARRRLTASACLWNLYRECEEKSLLDRFIAGSIDLKTVVELLRAKYPKLLARTLEA